MSAPRCSIVIPVHEHAGLTRRCLEAILSQAPHTPFEIVVVDDGSQDETPALLARQPDPVRSVRRAQPGGFAAACNEGAAHARGELLVFLNNDTEPRAGWLDALVAYADAHPTAAVVGAKLLFPDGSVQHAGVAVCQDGRPRHIYAGFPDGHPAVSRARELQAVTAACMLVRRAAWEQVGGFDEAFRNSLEDVDMCLRIRAAGGKVHYCPESVVTHLESVSRGRGSADAEHNQQLFAQRWEGQVRRDDVDRYIEDGLLRLHYRDLYPIGVDIAPDLALATPAADGASELIERQQRHIAQLLREVVRLTAHVAEMEEHGPPSGTPQTTPSARTLDDVEDIEMRILDLQRRLAQTTNGFEPSEGLAYRRLLTDIQGVVDERVPGDATVLVISRGDDEALELGTRRAWHFPQEADGTFSGSYPQDSADAVAQLEELRGRGARYLLVPSTSSWWLDHYAGFARHLRDRYRPLAETGECVLFELEETG